METSLQLNPVLYAHYAQGCIPITRAELDAEIAQGHDVDDFYERLFYLWENPSAPVRSTDKEIS